MLPFCLMQGSMGTYTLKLLTDHVIGNGSFGVVFEARIIETNEVVAIKKVLQDRRFKNRELQVRNSTHVPLQLHRNIMPGPWAQKIDTALRYGRAAVGQHRNGAAES